MEAAMNPGLPDPQPRRRAVRRTVITLVVIAVAFYAGFIRLAAQRA